MHDVKPHTETLPMVSEALRVSMPAFPVRNY
jgi:hypothetical protein